jgi:hypothetical protein
VEGDVSKYAFCIAGPARALHMPAYYLAVDHASKSVVLAVRGTASFQVQRACWHVAASTCALRRRPADEALLCQLRSHAHCTKSSMCTSAMRLRHTVPVVQTAVPDLLCAHSLECRLLTHFHLLWHLCMHLMQNTVTDLLCDSVEFLGGRAHRGLTQAAALLVEEALPDMKEALDEHR